MARTIAPKLVNGDDGTRFRIDCNDDSVWTCWDVSNAEVATVQIQMQVGTIAATVVTLRRSNVSDKGSFTALHQPDSLLTGRTMSDPIDCTGFKWLGAFVTTVAGGTAEADLIPCIKESNP